MYLLRAFIWALKPGFSLRLVVLLFLENHLQLRGWCSDWQVSGYVIKRQIQLFVCLGYCLLLVLTTGNWLYTGRFSSKICNVQVVCSLWPLGGGEEGVFIHERKVHRIPRYATVCMRQLGYCMKNASYSRPWCRPTNARAQACRGRDARFVQGLVSDLSDCAGILTWCKVRSRLKRGEVWS